MLLGADFQKAIEDKMEFNFSVIMLKRSHSTNEKVDAK